MTERLAVIGLGYVGLPLALGLSKHFNTVGYDYNKSRILDLQNGIDQNDQFESEEIQESQLFLTNNASDLDHCNAYIVTVPTPVNEDQSPDLEPLKNACNLIGKHISSGDIIIFESTVYPGCTEKFCGKILEEVSGLEQGIDFNLGYSPERINPGDKINTLESIVKIVAGDSQKTLERVTKIYEKIVMAGVYKAETIQVAEAAKLTENIQRDVNIALMNELSAIFAGLNITTADVLKAASTKWNFIPFRPGLVGGHCIGVDPYYLINEANLNDIKTPLLSAARGVNESVASRVIAYVTEQKNSENKKILFLGITFKENCSDTRNSKALYIAEKLARNQQIDIFDPNVNGRVPEPLNFVDSFDSAPYDFIIFAAKHTQFNELNYDFLKSILKPSGKIIDLTFTLSIPQDEGFSL